MVCECYGPLIGMFRLVIMSRRRWYHREKQRCNDEEENVVGPIAFCVTNAKISKIRSRKLLFLTGW